MPVLPNYQIKQSECTIALHYALIVPSLCSMSHQDTLNSVDMMRVVKSFVDRGVAGEYNTTLVRNYRGEVIDLRCPPAPLEYKFVQNFVGKRTYWMTIIPRGQTADGVQSGDLWQPHAQPFIRQRTAPLAPRTEITSESKLSLSS